MKTLKHFINGHYVAGSTEDAFELVSPVDGETYALSPNGGAAEVDLAYSAAAAAFSIWKKSTPAQRQKALLALADEIERNVERLVNAQSQETGQLRHFIEKEEIAASCDAIRFFAGAARVLEGRARDEYMTGLKSTIRREPLGVVAQVTPWHYPFMMAVWKIIPAIAAGNTVVDNVSFKAHAGEIIGIYGLMGAGRTELFECLLGTARHYFGKIWLDSKPVPQRLTTAERIRMGMSLVPEDRKRTGIFPISSVASNLTIASLWRRLQRGLTIATKKEEAVVASTIGNLSIKVSSPEVEIQALSGGNQQKVVIGRSLLTNPKVLFLDEPTRGIDIGAKGDVFRMMVQLSQQGMAVVFSTSDLKEIMAVSDRILVMSGGKLTADIVRDQAEESALVSASAQGF